MSGPTKAPNNRVCRECGARQCENPPSNMCRITAGCNGFLRSPHEHIDLTVRDYKKRVGVELVGPGPQHKNQNVLPEDSAARKDIPLCTGLLDYFPAALAYVARISKMGNDKHNPGEPLHHARGKSMDHADCCARHLVDRGGFDADGWRHSGYNAWRALALLQEELEEAGEAPLARGARLPEIGGR